MVLSFNNGTFSSLRAINGDDPEIEECAISVLSFGDERIISAGIATQDELDAMRSKEIEDSKAASIAYREEIDRREYERLKMKYESKSE